MGKTGRIAVAAAAVGLLWAGFAGRLAAEQRLDDRVTPAFARTAFDNATTVLAGALTKFARQGPPDAAAAALRDELSPLLTATVSTLGDTAEADSDTDLRAGADRLGTLARQLDDFITAHR